MTRRLLNSFLPVLGSFICLMATHSIHAQITVGYGKVLDAETNEPMAFTSVGFTGTSIGVTSDFNGDYYLETSEPVDSVFVQESGLKTEPCKYHQLIHIDNNGYQVNSDCEDVNNMLHKSWFVLPPLQEWYYKSTDPTYVKLPPYRSDCESFETKSLQLIYPEYNAEIYIPLEISGNKGKVVFEAAHRKQSAIIFWHIDNAYIGSTKNIHEKGLNISAGKHTLTLVDELGNSITRNFSIIGRE